MYWDCINSRKCISKWQNIDRWWEIFYIHDIKSKPSLYLVIRGDISVFNRWCVFVYWRHDLVCGRWLCVFKRSQKIEKLQSVSLKRIEESLGREIFRQNHYRSYWSTDDLNLHFRHVDEICKYQRKPKVQRSESSIYGLDESDDTEGKARIGNLKMLNEYTLASSMSNGCL